MTTRDEEAPVMTLIRPSPEADHDYARQQLPGLLTQSLDAQAERRVRAHLEGCERCRDACMQETAWMTAMRASPVVDLAPQAALPRLLSRIEARERRRARLAWLLHPWFALRRTRALALATAVQAAAIVGLVAMLGVLLVRAPAPREFRALSNPVPVGRADVPQLRLVFDDRLTSIEIRQLLDQVGGRIVDGPGPRGIFTVALAAAPAAGDEEAQKAVQWLRSRRGVRLAEIVGR